MIYKRYYASKDTISINNHYKQRLWNDLKCSKIKISDIEKLDYTQKSLIPFFVSYNKCNNNDNNNEVNKIKKDLFNLNLKAHLNNISATDSFLFNNDNASNFGNKQSVGIGLEAEFIYPFKKNKWSLIVEPNFKKINTKKSLDASNVSGGKLFVTYNFNLIEIPVGIRHYLFLNKNSKIFVNASYTFNALSKTTIELKRADNSIYNIYTSKSPNNFGLGLGYNFKDKYSLELRYHSRKNLLNDYSITSFEISTISLMLGYSIF